MTVLDDLAAELGENADELRARLTSPAADSIAVNYLTQDAKGNTGANFTGHVKASGIDFDGGPISTLVALNVVEWMRHTDGDRVAYAGAWEDSTAPHMRTARFGTALTGFSTPQSASEILAQTSPAGAPQVPRVLAQAARVDNSERASAAIIQSDGTSDFVRQGSTRMTFDYGPFTTGLNLVPAAGDVSVDVAVPAAVLNAAGAGQRVILGSIDGSSGAYEYVTWGVVNSPISGSLRIWFKNQHPSVAANFYFNFWARV